MSIFPLFVCSVSYKDTKALCEKELDIKLYICKYIFINCVFYLL